jgi:hypothetical protein
MGLAPCAHTVLQRPPGHLPSASTASAPGEGKWPLVLWLNRATGAHVGHGGVLGMSMRTGSDRAQKEATLGMGLGSLQGRGRGWASHSRASLLD